MRWNRLRLFSLWILLLPLTLHAQDNPLPLYDLPEPFAYPVQNSSTIAITRGGRVLVANAFVNSVSLILPGTGEIEAEWETGAEPKSVTITPNNLRALAVSADGLLVIDLESNEIEALYPLEGQPNGLVADDENAYISLQDHDEIIVMEIESGEIVQRIATPPYPAGLSLWADFLYVTHYESGQFSMIYLPAGEVVRTIQPDSQATLFNAVLVNPINGVAYLAQSINTSLVDNRFVPMLYVVDLETMLVTERINLTVADRYVSMPYALAQPSNRSRLYIAHAGSNDVTVLNLDTGLADTHFTTGANPRGILFNSGFTQVYTYDAVDGTLSAFDTQFFGLLDAIPTSSQPIPAQTQLGARLFYGATDQRLSAIPTIACASCHYVEQLSNTSLFNLEAETLNDHIEVFQGGSGLDAESLDMQALVDFLRNVP
ncbi:MAG: hypothetical protein KC496_01640 [Anaerolineae bacterium]|nr:hypothetical protein [Anaerolineae bacterium]